MGACGARLSVNIAFRMTPDNCSRPSIPQAPEIESKIRTKYQVEDSPDMYQKSKDSGEVIGHCCVLWWNAPQYVGVAMKR